MIRCPVCNELVNDALLRTGFPKCSNGHDLGQWVSCQNDAEKHVFLKYENPICPYCSGLSDSGVSEGTKVKCLHQTTDGILCKTRPFLWIKEGPPCFMNHVGKMILVA